MDELMLTEEMKDKAKCVNHVQVSWEVIENLITAMVGEAIRDHKPIGTIIAIGSGGIIPASMFAYQYGKRIGDRIRVHVIYAESYDGDKQGELKVHWPTEPINVRRHALIFDEIVDTGVTMAAFKKAFPHALTASIFHRQGKSPRPDIIGVSRPDELFYDFPWEQEYEH